jgi:hypothetical protein
MRLGMSSLEPVDGMHHALEFRPVKQIEDILFSRKHMEGDVPRFRNHPGGIFGRQITAGDSFKRELNQNAKPADATAFIVDFFLRGSRDRSFVH